MATMLKPIIYLVSSGLLLAITTAMAKVADRMGIPPLAFLTWSLAVGAVLLTVFAWTRDGLPALNARTFEYFVVTAFVTVAGSNLIFFSAVPEVGAGFVSLVITLTPLMTYLGALFFRIETFSTVRFAGVLAALSGALVLALGKLSSPDGTVFWVVLALVGPVLLTVGNLYRTLRWPAGETALSLAPGMLIAAFVMLFVTGLLPHFQLVPPSPTLGQGGLILLQGLLFAGQFALLFLLQASGGPVLLSILGAVAAVFGVPIAVLLLGEEVPDGLVVGGALIAVGVGLVNVRRSRARAPG